MNLLVVDDDRLFMNTIIRALKAREIIATTANGLPAAMTHINTGLHICEPFTTVLTDIDMPGGSGFQLAEKIVKLMPKPPRFIFMSGLIDGARRTYAETFGAKIFDKMELKAILDEVEAVR